MGGLRGRIYGIRPLLLVASTSKRGIPMTLLPTRTTSVPSTRTGAVA